MRKSYMHVFLVLVLVGLLAGPAAALTPVLGSRTVAYERIDPTAGLLAQTANTPVAYTLDAGDAAKINTFKLEFTITNATVMNYSSMKLCKQTGGVDSFVANILGTSSSTSLQVSVPGAAYADGDILYIAQDCDLAANNATFDVTLSGSLAVGQSASVRVVSTYSVPSSTLVTNSMYTAMKQFGAARIFPISNTININQGLKRFVVWGVNTSGAGPAAGSLAYYQNTLDLPIVDTTGIMADFVFSGNLSGVSSIAIRNAGGGLLGTTSVNPGDTSVTVEVPVSGLVSAFNASYAQATVDGTTPLAPRVISIAVNTVKGTSTVMAKDSVAGLSTTDYFHWSLNGLAFKTPYMRNDASLGISSAIRIDGLNDSAQNFYFWTSDNNGVDQVIPLGVSVNKGQKAVVLASDILAAADAAGLDINRDGFGGYVVFDSVSMNFDDWNIYATQNVGSSYRQLPILFCDNTGISAGIINGSYNGNLDNGPVTAISTTLTSARNMGCW